jgi:hypothetical protein
MGMGVFSISPAAKRLAVTRAVSGACWRWHTGAQPWLDRMSLGLVFIAMALVVSTFRDYGVTWDEDVHNWYGNFVLNYYLSLFGDKTALHW